MAFRPAQRPFFAFAGAFREAAAGPGPSFLSWLRHFAFLPAKAARPAAEVARCRGELGLESGLAPALVAAAPQPVPPDQFAVGAFDCVALAHAGAVLRRLAEFAPRLDGHVVLRYLKGSPRQLVLL